MLNVPVLSETGEQIGSEAIDAALLGGKVRASLLKQALVMYHANQRQGNAVNKRKSDVEGSTRKLYKQKGTGRARRGAVRTPVMKGGGRAFAKKPREYRQAMPKQMRRLARDQAVLAKIQSSDACIVDGLIFDAPKTRRFAAMLHKVHADRGCVFATRGADAMLHRSGRNIPKIDVMDVAELNAQQILLRRKLIFTRDAFAAFRETLSAKAADKAGD
ncbi:50S ribosomal protein L4 [Phycisphaerae bacterium RAS1]|nr:50S ribosomal protein L4 [Phycisphaerae bacterium RAS1]